MTRRSITVAGRVIGPPTATTQPICRGLSFIKSQARVFQNKEPMMDAGTGRAGRATGHVVRFGRHGRFLTAPPESALSTHADHIVMCRLTSSAAD